MIFFSGSTARRKLKHVIYREHFRCFLIICVSRRRILLSSRFVGWCISSLALALFVFPRDSSRKFRGAFALFLPERNVCRAIFALYRFHRCIAVVFLCVAYESECARFFRDAPFTQMALTLSVRFFFFHPLRDLMLFLRLPLVTDKQSLLGFIDKTSPRPA